MNFRLLLASISFLLLVGACQPISEKYSDTQVASFDGGVLRVEYPTKGNQDIVIYVNPDGSVDHVEGGAGSVDDFMLSEDELSFSAIALTAFGPRPMEFKLVKSGDGGYSGEYLIVRRCSRNCKRTSTATWDKGREKLSIPN